VKSLPPTDADPDGYVGPSGTDWRVVLIAIIAVALGILIGTKTLRRQR
jgi:hypothetical protein